MPIRVQTPGHGIVEFPDGTDEATMTKALQSLDAPEPSYLSQVGDRFTSGLKRAVHNPSVGAGLAGVMAAPFTAGMSVPAAMAAMGAAGAGGSVLTGARDVPTIATEGALSAAGEGLGRGVGAVAQKAGRLIYRAALRPAQAIQREFPGVVDTAMREGATVGESGAKRISGKLTASTDQAKQMVADAHAAGASPITTKEVAREFGDVFKQGRQQAQLGRPDPRPAVLQRLKAFDARHPAGINLDVAQPLKGEAQDLASRAYRAQDLGHPITDLSAASDEAMARGLRKGIEARVPGIDKVNSHTQELIGVNRALEEALRRNVSPIGGPRALLGDFVPAASSTVGLGLDRLGRSKISSAAMRTALLAALGQQEQE